MRLQPAKSAGKSGRGRQDVIGFSFISDWLRMWREFVVKIMQLIKKTIPKSKQRRKLLFFRRLTNSRINRVLNIISNDLYHTHKINEQNLLYEGNLTVINVFEEQKCFKRFSQIVSSVKRWAPKRLVSRTTGNFRGKILIHFVRSKKSHLLINCWSFDLCMTDPINKEQGFWGRVKGLKLKTHSPSQFTMFRFLFLTILLPPVQAARFIGWPGQENGTMEDNGLSYTLLKSHRKV